MIYSVWKGSEIVMTIGERIKQLRLKNNLTQEQLAEKCSVIRNKKMSAATVRKYELGILTNPKADTIRTFAAALNVSEYDLRGISTDEILKSLS